MWYNSGSGRIQIKMSLAQAQSASHPGRCDEDVAALLKDRNISWQISKLDPKVVKDELKEYGAWDDDELADHDANLARLVWLAAGDIVDSVR